MHKVGGVSTTVAISDTYSTLLILRAMAVESILIIFLLNFTTSSNVGKTFVKI